MVLRVLFITGLLLGFVSCSGNEVTDKTQTDPTMSALPDGEALFVNNCASCHGCDGTLGMSGAKNLADSKLTYSEALFTIEKGTDNGMPRFKEVLTGKNELESVAEFVMTLQRKEHE